MANAGFAVFWSLVAAAAVAGASEPAATATRSEPEAAVENGAAHPEAPRQLDKPDAAQVWLAVEEPSDGARHEGLPWARVQGWAGSGDTRGHDIVLLLDVSGSTRELTDVDVDGDGHIARLRRRRNQRGYAEFLPVNRDTDDTVIAAEVVATQRLLGALHPEVSRVGLVTFSDDAVLLAPPGSPIEFVREQVSEVPASVGGNTNLAAGLSLAVATLLGSGEPNRARSILVLSDGYPNLPGDPETAGDEAYARAVEARAVGVRIHTFGLGLRPLEKDDPYAGIASLTGGRYERLAEPGEIVSTLPHIDLAEVADVAMVNLTTGEAGKAVRVTPDGFFDGFVPLIPGENELQVTARGASGSERSELLKVFFAQQHPQGAKQAARRQEEAAKFLEALELRGLELRLSAEARRARQRKQLEVHAEQPAR